MSEEDLQDLKDNPYSKVEILDELSLIKIANIFLNTPWEYVSGMSIQKVGKEYVALKDFCKWEGVNPKTWIPVLNNMATAWIYAENRK